MKTFDLTPTNGRKSFGNKAKVIVQDNVSTLISYNTEVASYDHLKNKAVLNGYFSPTTMQHQNAFLEFYGFDKLNKQEIESINSIEKVASCNL